MPHDISLIATLAFGFGLALVFGFIAAKFKLPTLIGYLVAGFLIGPATPGFVADASLTNQLAELGVMLLMFGVGMHFSMKDLMAVKTIAVPGAVVQMSVATALGASVGLFWGWPAVQSVVFGLALSVASTVVLLKALESRSMLQTSNGQIAVGWLVVEDLAMVLILVLMPPMVGVFSGDGGATGQELFNEIAWTLVKVVAFVGVMLIVGKRLVPWMLWHIAKSGSRELFTLATVAMAISLAFIAASVFDVSFALGAFFAGMVMRESELSHRAAEESLPLRDAFAVLFFVSVGMLFQPQVFIDQPLRVFAVLAIIMVGKSIAAAGLVLLFKYPLKSALLIAASLAQIGEFSFILVGLGLYLGVVDLQVQSLVVAGAILSIALNPLLFSMVPKIDDWLTHRSQWIRNLNARSHETEAIAQDTQADLTMGHVIVQGYGSVGKRVVKAIEQQRMKVIVVDVHREKVEKLREHGKVAVSGDLLEPITLVQAHIAHAKALIITELDYTALHEVIENAKLLNPHIQIHLNGQSKQEEEYLSGTPNVHVYRWQNTVAKAMADAAIKQAMEHK